MHGGDGNYIIDTKLVSLLERECNMDYAVENSSDIDNEATNSTLN